MTPKNYKILITGSKGFIAKNLILRLSEIPNFEVLRFTKDQSLNKLTSLIKNTDAIIHLAGENRPDNITDFKKNNSDFTSSLAEILSNEIQKTNRKIPLIFSSSTQVNLDNHYGRSKLNAENTLKTFSKEYNNPLYIYRLPGVFGKWCKPHYNSVVATFCSNIANNIDIDIHEPDKELRLVYIDDLVDSFIANIVNTETTFTQVFLDIEYKVSLGELGNLLKSFHSKRKNILIDEVGTGFHRALYSTYISYLPTDDFSYSLTCHEDSRGRFVEMLKTKNSGQFSFFTAHPGITRGGHYHHTKTEKFLVIKGKARFLFRHMNSGEVKELITNGSSSEVVDTVPGWAHDITNIGDEELIVMLWANENFNKHSPDTITYELQKNEEN